MMLRISLAIVVAFVASLLTTLTSTLSSGGAALLIDVMLSVTGRRCALCLQGALSAALLPNEADRP